MSKHIISQNLGDVSELIVIMPLKQGFVPTRRLMSYATRTRLLLQTLNGIRKKSIEERDEKAFLGPIEALAVIDNVRWSILNDESELMMAVSFRGAWEPYIRKIAIQAGVLLDAVLCNCEGYEDFQSDLGYPKFAEWVKKHQVRTEYFYSALYDITVKDLNYFKSLAFDVRNCDDFSSTCVDAVCRKVNLTLNQDDVAVPVKIEQGISILSAMYELSHYFLDEDSKFLLRLCHRLVDTEFKFYLALLRALDPKLDQTLPNTINFQEVAEKFSEEDTAAFQTFLQEIYNPQNTEVRAFLTNLIPAVHLAAKNVYRNPIQWFNKPQQKPHTKPNNTNLSNPGTVQINILESITEEPNDLTHGCFLLLGLEDTSAEEKAKLLTHLYQFVSTYQQNAAQNGNEQAISVNLCFTYLGLKSIGVSKEVLDEFPLEFQQGMEARAALLGDIRYNHPNNWVPPKAFFENKARADINDRIDLAAVDIILHVQTSAPIPADRDDVWDTDHPLYHFVKDELLADGYYEKVLLAVELMRRLVDQNGHFDFVDGISQPKWKLPKDSKEDRDLVKLGEILLGYENDYGDPPPAQDLLFNNGTFLVIRKLEQDVPSFEKFLEKAGERELYKKKMMGRTTDGKNLIDGTKGNDFDYEQDPLGEKCPLHSHIRRANPRNPEPHKPIPRIMRRSMSYGPVYQAEKGNEHAERGLFFIAYNASIAHQFEVIQRWLTGGNDSGCLSSEHDPFLGVPKKGDPRNFRFVENDKVERQPLNLAESNEKPTQLVTLRWGSYLFVPSTTGIRKLIEFCQSSSDEPTFPTTKILKEKAEETIKKLQFLELIQDKKPAKEAHEHVANRWHKLLLEPSVRASGLSTAIWENIRTQHGGAMRTPFGVLVASQELIMNVLRDDINYSVNAYCERMEQSLGQGFLGLDNAAATRSQYQKEALPVNKLIENFVFVPNNGTTDSTTRSYEALHAAFDHASIYIQNQVKHTKPLKRNVVLSVTAMSEYVIGKLAQQWFAVIDDAAIKIGTKTDPEIPHCPHDFINTAKFVFSPHPTDYIRDEACTMGRKIADHCFKFVENAVKNPIDKSFRIAEPLIKTYDPNAPDDINRISRTIANLIKGFSSPTFASGLKTFNSLIDSKTLTRFQSIWLAKISDKNTLINRDEKAALAEALFKSKVINIMRADPAPGLIHREAKHNIMLGPVSVKAGDRIVLSLESAAREKSNKSDTEILFGGDITQRGKGIAKATPTHACPGQIMALEIILGQLCAVMEAGRFTRYAPLNLELQDPPLPS